RPTTGRDAALDAVRAAVATRQDVELRLYGPAEDRPSVGDVLTWSIHVWEPDTTPALREFTLASLAAVPTVAGATPVTRRFIDEGIDGVLVEDADVWGVALGTLVGDRDARRRIGTAARSRADAVSGPAAAAAVLNRFLGWAVS